jgi:hypothetical protein
MTILAYHSQDKWDTTCRLTWRVLQMFEWNIADQHPTA